MLREDLAAARADAAAWRAEASAGGQILLARYAAEVTSLGVEIVAAQRESDDLRAAKDDELQAVGAARAARAELLAAETALRREEQVAKAKADMEDKAARERAAAEEAEAKARVAEDYAAAVGRNGFLGRIFDELLVEIADATNAALADVPNVTDCSLAFRSEVVGAKGKTVRQNIVPVLTVGGQEIVGRDLDGASGGMQSAVELAADFAGILGVVERRLGWSPGWVMIDEAFEGLDASSREATVEYLRALARDRLVLVIDHGSEIGGLFESRIVVKSENRKSWVANG
jgi:DNA repair exonuclease SbcCD ATPase subunit